MKISLAQINPIVGDFGYNIGKIVEYYDKAIADGADVVVFPELALCGYPPEDLLLKKHFLDHNTLGLQAVADRCNKKTLIVGFAQPLGDECYNAAAIITDGKIVDVYHKKLLPNYGVFDERRYFVPGNKPVSFVTDGVKIAVTICEDIWQTEKIASIVEATEDKHLLLNLSASPFHKGKIEERKRIIAKAAGRFDTPIAYCNMVGGQDELVFDGRSMFTNIAGVVLSKAAVFDEDMISANITLDDSGKAMIEPCQDKAAQPRKTVEEVYGALVLGTRDYVRKSGFKKIIMGLSGGIDSALVAAIAVEALGKENVIGVTMPSKFNSSDTISDAGLLAQNLGIEFHTIPIADTLGEFHNVLGLVDGWDDSKTAYENLQARIRGTMLMSLSNQFGYMVLTTGNKSETAVGYSTLYGDTAGGFAIIKDVPKTLVFKLSEYVNEHAGREVIPVSTITRPPSAELRPDQKDTDSLPDYDMLDSIVTHYVEMDCSAQEIVNELGYDAAEINRVIRLIDCNEYKRRQSPPGIKITPKAFGRDRRLPITNHYRTQMPPAKF
ncbi:MAG: NAD+ synthase [Sedimentisphaeraceae bacterium JB056]